MQFPDDFQKRAKAVCPQESKNLNTGQPFDEALESGNLAIVGLVLRDARTKLSVPTPEEILDYIEEERLTELKNLLEKIVQLNRLLEEYDQMVAGQPAFIGSITLSPTGNRRASFFYSKNLVVTGLCFKFYVSISKLSTYAVVFETSCFGCLFI